MTELPAGQPTIDSFWFLAGESNYCILQVFRPVLESTDPPPQWIPEVVLLEHEADSSPLSRVKVTNECCHAFIACTETTLYSTQCTFCKGHANSTKEQSCRRI